MWMTACAFAMLRGLVLGWRLRRVIARARPAPAALLAEQRRIARALGIVPPQLVVSDEVAAPFAFGAWAQVVVLPTALIEALDANQLELVLHHELVHIRRGDPRMSLLIEACAVLFASYPAARRLVTEIRLARELAVDAEVARADAHAYATLLVEVAALARSGTKLAHVSMDDTALTRRIAMLTQKSSNQTKLGPRAVITAAVLVAGLGLAVSRVFAGPPQRIFHTRQGGSPLSGQQAEEIQACFDEARRADPDLAVDTTAQIEAKGDGTVVFASVPTPNSPAFQSCVENKAMEWKLAPPPEAPEPPPQADAKLHIRFPIRLPSR
jgi:hypothetical protein